MSPYLDQRSAPGPAPIALGAMNFGKRTSKADALRILGVAADAGIGLVDTANAYNDGESERVVGEGLRGKRDAWLVATKVGFGRVDGKPEGLSATRIRQACDGSLSRLGIDVIDLYYLHVPDPATPIEESLGALSDLLAAGKVRAWGVSNYASWQILEMRTLAAAASMPPPCVAQQLYNLLVRQLDVEYFKFTKRFPLHTTVYNPLAGGLLAGTQRAGEAVRPGSRFDKNTLYQRRYLRNAMFAAVEALRSVAEGEGMTLVDLAYAFVFRHPSVDSVLVGPGSVAHLEAALAAQQRALSDGARAKVLEIYQELVGTDASYTR